MKKKKLTFLFNLIIYGLPLYLVISTSIYYYQYYLNNTPKKNIEKRVGCVIGTIAKGRGFRSLVFEFNYNKIKYQAETSVGCDFEIGEKFIVEFEKGNPKINRVNQDEPVFLEGESVGYSVGYVERLNFCFMKTIRFIYYVNAIKYEQSYEPSEDLKTKYPLFKERKKFIVKYWIDNPARSIILPYKPTDNSL